MLVAFIRRWHTLEVIGHATTTTPPALEVSQVPPIRRGEKKAPTPDVVYAAAFARVRLVRAWIGVAAATVALSYAFAALLDRVLP